MMDADPQPEGNDAQLDAGLSRSLLDLEERFWTAGAEFYRQHLAAEFVMVFPGLGIVGRDATIEGIAGGRRWESVELEEPRVRPLADGVALLTYRAIGRRGGDPPYAALVSSAYIRQESAWKLTFHHQSPLGATT